MKYYLLLLLSTVVITFVSCGEKRAAQVAYEEDDGFDKNQVDSTIYGICSEGSTMHTLQLITDNGDTLTLSLLPAQEAGRTFGGYSIGDHMAVLANSECTQATMVVNLTTLLGEWVMPNPMDGSSEMGLLIRDGGIAESINQSSIVYETWRLINGQLELMSVREGSADFEEVERYQLLYLTADSLAYGNEEETYEYSRPHPEEDYSHIGVELDDEALDDMIM